MQTINPVPLLSRLVQTQSRLGLQRSATAARGVNRTFTSQPMATRFTTTHPLLHHEPSERILSKAAASHSVPRHSNTRSSPTTTFPDLVRDTTSYLALGALTSGAAFAIYCWVSNISSYPSLYNNNYYSSSRSRPSYYSSLSYPLPFQATPWMDRSDF
jgi:hypothetical protein